MAEVAGQCIGSDSAMYTSLTGLYSHIERHDMNYSVEFRNDKLFGGNFLDQLHYWVQRFLESCASGKAKSINLKHLDFNDIKGSIERREYHSKRTIWLTKLMKKRAEGLKKPIDECFSSGITTGGGGQSGGGGQGKRRKLQPQDNSKKISNGGICQQCKLTLYEQFRDMFHPRYIRNLEKPKKNGIMLCMRFYTLGYFFSDCK